jgi:hypothetical protein
MDKTKAILYPSPMKFLTDSRTLLNSLPTLTGDAARLGHRLSQALDLIEAERRSNRELRAALIRARDHLIMSGTKCTDAPEALKQANTAIAKAEKLD